VSEWDERQPNRPHEPRDPNEGVRILGPDEAADVVERGEAQPRFRPDRPRYGDRPAPPPPDGPRASMRFPLDAGSEVEQYERPPVVPIERHRAPNEVSHWAESAVEEIPNMTPHDPYGDGDEADPWSTVASAGPRWRDDRGGAPGPTHHGEPVAYEEYEEPPPGRSVFGDAPAPPPPPGPARPDAYEDAYRDEAYDEPAYDQQRAYVPTGVQGDYEQPGEFDESYDDNYSDDEGYDDPPRVYVESPDTSRRAQGRTSRRTVGGGGAQQPGGDRDMRTAAMVGVGLVGAALVLFQVGPAATMVLVTAILGYASFEYFTATQRAGFDPLMPVGVAATVGLVLTAYNYGEAALPMVLVLSLVVCLAWYLIDAGGERPMANVGATLLGICWIGLFGSFAGLLLSAHPYGISLLTAAVVPTIGYDVGALFVGKSAGSRPLSPASPNKTVEGLLGGMALALIAGIVLGAVGPAPFDSVSEGLKIGLVAALVAPLGDLGESLLKRDLGIKDMGTLLPGHGGLLDRFDALLFVLPAIWYLARVSDFFVS
jgi:phosphatidate cytidylyltransferase